MDIQKLPTDEWAELHAAFSNPKRIELMIALYPEKELSFTEAKKVIKVGSGTLNYHLELLREAKLIDKVPVPCVANIASRRGDILHALSVQQLAWGDIELKYKLTERGRKIIDATRELMKERGKYSR